MNAPIPDTAITEARLIAAAPELLEVAALALQLVETDSIHLWRTVPDKLKAAIAKARGQ